MDARNEQNARGLLLIGDLRPGSYIDSRELSVYLAQSLGPLELIRTMQIMRIALQRGLLVKSPTPKVYTDMANYRDFSIRKGRGRTNPEGIMRKRAYKRKVSVYKRTDVPVRLPPRIISELGNDEASHTENHS